MTLLHRWTACLGLACLMLLCTVPAHGGKVDVRPMGAGPSGGVDSMLGGPPPEWPESRATEEPGVTTVVAEGTADVFRGNVDRARMAALRAAYAEAVSRGGGIDVRSLMLVRDVRQVSDVVMSRSRGFIRSYQVLSEGLDETNPDSYRVVIEADVVSEGSSKQDELEGLSLYLNLLGNPTVLIMLPESMSPMAEPEPRSGGRAPGSSSSESEIRVESEGTNIVVRKGSDRSGDGPADGLQAAAMEPEPGSMLRSTEAALAQAFSRYGYNVITSDDLLAENFIEAGVLNQARRGVTAQAVRVARMAGADISLLGVIRLSRKSVKAADVPLAMVTAEASAKALISSTGKLISAFHQVERASAPDRLMAYSDCLDKVATNIVDVLAWKIPKLLTEHGRETRLTLYGVDVAEAQRVRDALRDAPGMETVRFARVPVSGEDLAELVLVSGFVRMDAHEVLEIAKNASGSPLQLIRTDKFRIVLDTDPDRSRGMLKDT